MAFSNFLYLTEQSSGAPRNSGTAGDLNNLLNWALVTTHGGWTREFHNSSTNESIFRPNIGIRNRLYVRHDSASSGGNQYATVRGCESASSASSLTDPFPTVSQLANNMSRWQVSNVQNTTNMPFKIFVWETGIIYLSQYGGINSNYKYGAFFDTPSYYPSDVYNTVCIVNHNSSNSFANTATTTNLAQYGTSIYFMRDITGATKSTYGSLNATGTFLGNAIAPPIKGGYLNKIIREPVGINCIGSATATPGTNALQNRGWFPNIWNAMHSFTIEYQNINITDANYDPTASFLIVNIDSGSTMTNNAFIETTNTWSLPDLSL